MRKSLILTAFLLLTVSVIALAQPPRGQVREKMKALRIATFTEVLDLNAKEAQAFWPLYNEMEDKMKAIAKGMRPDERPNWSDLSDAEIEKLARARFKAERQRLDLEEEYFEKFKKVLPMQKVARIPQAERQFKMAVLKQAKAYRSERFPDAPDAPRLPQRPGRF